jgi:hypothetical protein
MKHPLKALLLIMLLLTLPLRGFAAVAGFAEPAHGHDGVSMSHQAGMHDDICMHEHQAGPMSHHDHPKGHGGEHAGGCTVCGACCTGAISVSFFSITQAHVVPSSQVIAFDDQIYAGFIPEGPERPPRTSPSHISAA